MKAAARRGWLSLKNAEAMKLDLREGARAVIERQYHIVAANHEGIRDRRNRA